ncbi:type II toxin-antitoxin system antitoxin DNA ADP-ribosyl glycohydrolase DarG [Peribacillus frigoritolerans]|uniref:Macro domain-containing protein n=1 Tax=Peribacillus frigoritolerans TaxID=450367 RepID=A0AAJ1QJL2_9BACI|nr:macro domain-containing protein [Peribacillus frigoritolerans]MDM5282678.1 macro domain-containing protein [Peribacillus frigoritolerans]
MISFVTGNLLRELDEVEAIVNTVNCVGVMGKGIALEFKKRFPDNYDIYKKACSKNEVTVGNMLVYPLKNNGKTKFVINFPTKKHWRQPSKMEYVEEGLDDLVKVLRENKIQSIAIPALGCGNGKLSWGDVKPLIIKKLQVFKDIDIKVYEPSSMKEKQPKTITNSKPRLSKERKLLLLLIDKYNNSTFSEKATHIEVNHLAYLLQSYNEKLKLEFTLKKFGPISTSVNDVLIKLNGHYINVKRRESKATAIEVITTKFPGEKQLIKDKTLLGIKQLINGFENEEGLMILSVVHWFYSKEHTPTEKLLKEVKNWCKANEHSIKDELIVKCIDRISTEYTLIENLTFDL